MSEKRLTSRARRLRRDATDAETLLWSRLRNRQLDDHKFVRQFPTGNAIADFACRSARIIIELDGGQHAITSDADQERTGTIEHFGYRVVRFWNNEVIENIEGVLESIQQELRIAGNR